MVARSRVHVGTSALGPGRVANSAQRRVAHRVHWTLVCVGLIFFTRTGAAHSSQHTSVSPSSR
jgi:hypothetical protein